MYAKENRLLEIKDLRIQSLQKDGVDSATPAIVKGLNLTIHRARTLCLVSESGCGKGLVCRAIANHIRLTGYMVSGHLVFYPESDSAGAMGLNDFPPEQTNNQSPEDSIPEPSIALVAQEPIPSLSRHYPIGNQIINAMQSSRKINKQRARRRAVDLLGELGVQRPDRLIFEYPIDLPNETRLRIILAMALSCAPSLLIIDDPATMLDLPNRGQILDKIAAMQDELGMAVLMSTCDLNLAEQLADDVAVMYQGKIVEIGQVHTLFSEPEHPFTQSLFGKRRMKPKTHLETGKSSRLKRQALGCAYRPFCSLAMPVCKQYEPRLVTVRDGHDVRCLIHEALPQRPMVQLDQHVSENEVWQLERFLMR